MPLPIADILTSPEHYLHSFDGDDALFVPMDRAAYRRSIFLDRRISSAASGTLRVPTWALASLVAKPEPTGWIFHIAHCGSTLLARALGELGENLVLREPLAMRQLALAPDPQRLATTLALLARRFEPAAPTIVKANVPVNFMLGAVARADPTARAVLLYSALDDYLPAILRSPDHRAWVRAVTTQLAAHLGDLTGLSDAERGAALWLAQMRHYAEALTLLPNARSLEAEAFLGRPRDNLAAAARHLGVSTETAKLDAVVSGPLFATNSKNPAVAFDNAARLARRAALAETLGDELASAREWVARTAPDAAVLLAMLEGVALAP